LYKLNYSADYKALLPTVGEGDVDDEDSDEILRVCESVLPGHEEASPLVQTKLTAIWQKHTAYSNFKKFRYFSAMLGLFL
jgi:hypothetical protein